MARPPKRMFRRPDPPAATTPGASPGLPPEELTANLDMKVGGQPVKVALTVPNRPVPPGELLPVFRRLTEVLIDQAEHAAAARGACVSCRERCSACCYQLVPASPIEARRLAALVEALPEPRRSAILARFAEAARLLDEAGLLETLRHPERVPAEDRAELGMRYFRLGIPCPFLQDDLCSIHPDRPLVCREYLVTSPAEHCAHPTKESVRRLEMPARLSGTLARFGDDSASAGTTWVPLVLAPEWAEAHPDTAPERPGPEWLRILLLGLSGRDLPE